jgi:hypothetical protein
VKQIFNRDMEFLIGLGVIKAAAVGVYIFSHSVTDDKAPPSAADWPTYSEEPPHEHGMVLTSEIAYEPQQVPSQKPRLAKHASNCCSSIQHTHTADAH